MLISNIATSKILFGAVWRRRRRRKKKGEARALRVFACAVSQQLFPHCWSQDRAMPRFSSQCHCWSQKEKTTFSGRRPPALFGPDWHKGQAAEGHEDLSVKNICKNDGRGEILCGCPFQIFSSQVPMTRYWKGSEILPPVLCQRRQSFINKFRSFQASSSQKTCSNGF